MRTTIDIDEALLKEAMRHRGTGTKKELINGLLQEELRRWKMQDIKKAKGKVPLRYSLDAFLKFRHQD